MIKISTVVYILLLCILIPLYFLAPSGVSPILIWGCLFVFYVYFFQSLKIPVIISPGIPSLIKPDTFFMLFYYIIYFLPYQLYVLGLGDLMSSKYLADFYIEHTNVSIVTSTIGLISFVAGYRKYLQLSAGENNYKSELNYYRYLPHLVLILLLCFMGLFYVTGAEAMFSGSYATSDVGTTTENGIYFLVSHFVVISIAVSIFFIRAGKLPFTLKLALTLGFCWILGLMVMGDRSTFFIVILVAVAGVATYIRQIRLVQIVVLIFGAFFLYNVIEVARTADSRGISAIFNAALEGGKGESIGEGSFSISTISSRAVFQIVPDKYDYFMGKFKLIGLAGIVPYSRSLFVSSNDPFTASSKVLADELLNSGASWGVGSNIIVDIYMDFGIIGVLVLMYLLGLFASYIQYKATLNANSIKWGTIYLILVALYAVLPRYTFDFPVRNIAWTVLLFLLYAFLRSRLSRRLS